MMYLGWFWLNWFSHIMHLHRSLGFEHTADGFLLPQKARSDQMQVYLALLHYRFISSKERGQWSPVPGLKLEGFIDFGWMVMTSQPGAGTVPRYGQNLTPGWALGWTSHFRKADCMNCQKRQTGLLVPFHCSAFLSASGIGGSRADESPSLCTLPRASSRTKHALCALRAERQCRQQSFLNHSGSDVKLLYVINLLSLPIK